MSESVTCPECDREYGSPRAFYSHWGQSHGGPSPDIDAELEFSEEHRRKISENRSGIPTKEETREKISQTLEGRVTWRGEHVDPEERARKISEALEGHDKSKEQIENHADAIREAWDRGAYDNSKEVDFSGENNPCYKHGDYIGGYAEYPAKFNPQLREKVRDRDGRVCRVCGEGSGQFNVLDVHHIDGNRENCDKGNLISLCRSCHGRMNQTSEQVQRMAYSTGPSPEWGATGRVV